MPKKTKCSDKTLIEAILSLRSESECDAFLEDICTIQEREALAQRLEVARLLALGVSYNEINRQTGASTATIGRVSRALNYGGGGYKTVIERMENDEA